MTSRTLIITDWGHRNIYIYNINAINVGRSYREGGGEWKAKTTDISENVRYSGNRGGGVGLGVFDRAEKNATTDRRTFVRNGRV